MIRYWTWTWVVLGSVAGNSAAETSCDNRPPKRIAADKIKSCSENGILLHGEGTNRNV